MFDYGNFRLGRGEEIMKMRAALLRSRDVKEKKKGLVAKSW